MEKLKVCRVCLASDTQMRLIVNKKIHKVFEKLTELPFLTTDSRPKLVCYICCGLLYNCHQLRINSLRSEQFFQQAVNCPEAAPMLQQLPTAKKYQKTPIVQMNCTRKIPQNPQEETPVKQLTSEKNPVKIQNTEYTKTQFEKQVSVLQNTPVKKVTEKTITPTNRMPVVDKIEENKETRKEPKSTEDHVIDLDDDFISNIIKKASERLEKPKYEDKHVTNEQTEENLDSEDNTDQMNDSDDVPLKAVQEMKRCEEPTNKKKKRKRAKTIETEDIDSNLDNAKPTHPKPAQKNKTVKQETPGDKVVRKSPRNRTVPNKPTQTSNEELLKVSSTSTHDEILCNQCDNVFSDKQKLTEHLKLETDMIQITIHKCDICFKCFRSKCILNRHVRMHTEKYLHKCNVCSGLFTDVNFLKEHLRHHIDSKN